MDVKNWFMPSVAFGMFIYVMLFIIVYVIKIGGPNVSFYEQREASNIEKKTDIENYLGEISEGFK